MLQENISQLCCWAATCSSRTCWEVGQAVALIPLCAPFQAALSAAAVKRCAKMAQEKDTAQGVKNKKARNRNPPGIQPWQILCILEMLITKLQLKAELCCGSPKPTSTKMGRQNSICRPKIHGLTAEAFSWDLTWMLLLKIQTFFWKTTPNIYSVSLLWMYLSYAKGKLAFLQAVFFYYYFIFHIEWWIPTTLLQECIIKSTMD